MYKFIKSLILVSLISFVNNSYNSDVDFTVGLCSTKYTVQVELNETIQQIIEKIAKITGIPMELIHLFINAPKCLKIAKTDKGFNIPYCNDKSKKLSDYGITQGMLDHKRFDFCIVLRIPTRKKQV